MASSSSYSPDESNNTIIREELWLQGTLLDNFLFGIQTTLCFLAFIAVLRKRTTKHGRMRIALSVYIAVLFALTTAAQGLKLQWIQMGFITQRNYPGGPDAFLSNEESAPINLVPNIMAVITNWMMECLLVWRCHVVCSNTGRRVWLLGVAIPLFLLFGLFGASNAASIVLSSTLTVFQPAPSLLSAMTRYASLLIYQMIHTIDSNPYILVRTICSLALNLVATGFITGRLLSHRHYVVSQLGQGHGDRYVSIAAVVVESAAIYTGFLIIVIVVTLIQSPATILVQRVTVQVQMIASLFIIWRIARGERFSASADTVVTSARPSSQPNVIQLGVLSTRPDEAEEASIQRTENESKGSFQKSSGEV